MQEEIVRVDLMTFVHSDSMEEKEGIITALQSIQDYEEKVGDDGLLELSFTPKETHLTDAEVNPVRFCIQVSRKIIDPNDFRNNYYVFEADQLVAMSYPNASLVRSPDMKTIVTSPLKLNKVSYETDSKPQKTTGDNLTIKSK
ncbi:hypothetical protein IUY40_11040 [Flavobacterium sp. ALJ2]|uniref:hypothetical protein n=1 Tax=Flavobacterium sp. ALJ2 TaxID=2786960 RepID=UPI00189D4564|nr:hypothetical protein [Flavobacterium sp. ALJ2]MBF7092075.1 hypothetical protein [Flavobacterium sp. ALJ2]